MTSGGDFLQHHPLLIIPNDSRRQRYTQRWSWLTAWSAELLLTFFFSPKYLHCFLSVNSIWKAATKALPDTIVSTCVWGICCLENGIQQSATEASSHQHASQLSVITPSEDLSWILEWNSSAQVPLYFSQLQTARETMIYSFQNAYSCLHFPA